MRNLIIEETGGDNMPRGRMIKFEKLHQEFRAADERALNAKDWESRRSFGPTLTFEQIKKPVDAAWASLVAEVKRQATKGNEYAKRMLAALDERDEPRGSSWLDAVDEYYRDFC